MAQSKLNDQQKKQAINLLKKSNLSAAEIAKILDFPMECVRSLKSHVTMGTYNLNESEAIEDMAIAQETSLSIERDLQTFLCKNLNLIESGLKLYKEGKEFVIDIGRIDILTEDETGNILVVELKAGKAKDSALGQLLGYMGYISKHIAKDKKVRGCIIASDFDERLKYAVQNLPNVKLKLYKVNFSFIDVI